MVVVETHIHFKNAVSPDYWGRCTSSYVSADTDLIFVEGATSMWGPIDTFNDSMAAVKHHAPLALPFFLNWYRQDIWAGRATYSKMKGVARSQSFEMISFDLYSGLSGKPWLTGARKFAKDSASREAIAAMDHSIYTYYADMVHPSASGHTLIGEIAAHRVASQLQPWLTGSLVEGSSADSAGRANAPTAASYTDQVCYSRADQLPVERTSESAMWKLIDAGKAKGVPKLGLLSTQEGARLSLRVPIELGQDVNCTNPGVAITLGYLVSSQPGMGQLELSCTGCVCQGYTGRKSAGHNSFPLLETAAVNMPFLGLGNASVTSTTTFLAAALGRNRTCMLTVTHARRSRCSPLDRSCAIGQMDSHVRVDSMHVRGATAADEKGVRLFRTTSLASAQYLEARACSRPVMGRRTRHGAPKTAPTVPSGRRGT